MLEPIKGEITVKLFRANDDKKRLIKSLENEQPQIVIGTPGRLLDLVVKENALKTYTTKYLILDEADMLFDFDFMSQIDPIVQKLTSKVFVFSATMPKNLLNWVNKYFGYADLIDLTDEVNLNIDHYILMAGMDKDYRLLQLLKVINPFLCIIFVSKNEMVTEVYQMLLEKGYNVTRVSSKLSMKERKNIINEARTSKYQYIVASDLASRGIDFLGVTHIINYDLPYQLDFYIHRSGRTGRMGAHGEVYSFYEDKFSRKFASLEKRGIKFKKIRISNDGELVPYQSRKDRLKEEEIQAIKKIKKPTKVKPGYRKKNKEKIEKALRKVRRKRGEK
jgi:ATP-dependent RNA helicase CshB